MSSQAYRLTHKQLLFNEQIINKIIDKFNDKLASFVSWILIEETTYKTRTREHWIFVLWTNTFPKKENHFAIHSFSINRKSNLKNKILVPSAVGSWREFLVKVKSQSLISEWSQQGTVTGAKNFQWYVA